MERQERIVNSVGALKSIRNLDILMEEGIAELVDNSVDEIFDENSHPHFEKGHWKLASPLLTMAWGWRRYPASQRFHRPSSMYSDSVGEPHHGRAYCRID